MCSSVDIPFTEGPVNLNWSAIIGTIKDDPLEFFKEGGWGFLADQDAVRPTSFLLSTPCCLTDSLFPVKQEEGGSDDSSEEGSSFNASSDGAESESGSDFDDGSASESGSEFDDEEEDSGDDWDAQVRSAPPPPPLCFSRASRGN